MTVWSDFGFRENPYAVEPLDSTEVGSHLLIGRDDELRRLEQAIVSLDLHPTIEGPIGAGKTSLMAVARHRLDSDQATARFFFDSNVTIQMTGETSASDIERKAAFAIAQFFIKRSDELRMVGLDIPDTSLVDKWLNLPVFRGGEAGAVGFHAGMSQQATQSQGFDEAGFVAQVSDWLATCFPTRATGGIICTLDNLELLESSGKARTALEQLRDGSLSWPGLRWVLAGSSGIVRTAVMSPRLHGYLSEPIAVSPLRAQAIPEVIRARIREFAVDDDPFIPVEPDHFQIVYDAVKGNLRAAMHLCQEFALEIHTGGSYPVSPAKAELILEFLNAKAEGYQKSAGSLPDRCWLLLDDLASGGGTFTLSQHTEYDFQDREAFTHAAHSLEATNLLTRIVVFGHEGDIGYEVTPGGWLVARSRRDTPMRLEALRGVPSQHPSPSEGGDEKEPSTRRRVEMELGYRAPQVCHLVGITFRQLDYWARTNLIVPSLRSGLSGNARLYSFRDVVLTNVVKSLLDAGLSLKKIRSAIELIREYEDSGQPLSGVTLLSDGQHVHLALTEKEVVRLFRSGQGVFGIALGPIVDEVEIGIHSLFPEDQT